MLKKSVSSAKTSVFALALLVSGRLVPSCRGLSLYSAIHSDVTG